MLGYKYFIGGEDNKLIKKSIRKKLTIVYLLVFLIAYSVSSISSYLLIRNILKDNITTQLDNQSNSIKDMIEVAIDTSIRNHLRTICEKNKDIIKHYHELTEIGERSSNSVVESVSHILRSQSIGSSGYIYLLNSQGTLVYHPFEELVNENIIEYEFIKEQVRNKSGYIEYQWKNPGDESPREKVLYMEYYQPLDLIISASGYKDEFLELVVVDDFKDNIIETSFGESGYSILISDSGKFLIHPGYQGRNLIAEEFEQGKVIESVISQKNGVLRYKWKNPEDEYPREKIGVFRSIDNLNWIVLSTGYEDEFYRPLYTIGWVFISIGISTVLIAILITVKVSKNITYPLIELKKIMKVAQSGDYSVRSSYSEEDEIGDLSSYFNDFLGHIQAAEESIKSEIQQKNNALNELKKLNDDLEEIIKKRTITLENTVEALKSTQNQLIAFEKQMAIKELLINISHQLNTPIGNSVTSLSHIKSLTSDILENINNNKLSKETFTAYLSTLKNSIELMEVSLKKTTSLLKKFKQYRNDDNHMESFKLLDLINQTLDDFNNSLEGVEIEIVCDERLETKLNRESLSLLIEILVDNSIKHGLRDIENGKISIICTIEGNDSFKYLNIRYFDNGIGLSDNDRDKLFNPLFKKDDSMKQMGMGLSILQNSLRYILKGTIEVLDNDLGLEYLIRIPLNK